MLGAAAPAESGDITATIGLVCSARVIRGHEAAAPPASAKNSRRRIPAPKYRNGTLTARLELREEAGRRKHMRFGLRLTSEVGHFQTSGHVRARSVHPSTADM